MERTYSSLEREIDDAEMKDLHEFFMKHNSCFIPNILNKNLVFSLKIYLRTLVERGLLKHGDPWCDKRFGGYRDPVIGMVSPAFIDTVSRIVGNKLKPSLTKFGIYTQGATLEPHIDYPATMYALDISIDHIPERGSEPWGLNVGDKKYFLNPGDAAFYKGGVMEHWREKMVEKKMVTNIFLFFVDEGYEGVLDVEW